MSFKNTCTTRETLTVFLNIFSNLLNLNPNFHMFSSVVTPVNDKDPCTQHYDIL